MSDFQKTSRNEVRRVAGRGKYDRKTIYEILDRGYVCHVAFTINEQPFIIPTLYARLEDSVLIHGSSISRMLTRIAEGIPVCLSVTHVDGLVLARSAFHHSMNYRSAVIFGTGRLIDDGSEKLIALKSISDNVLPGRWEDTRQPTKKELNVTSVVKIAIDEASAKIRKGDPVDDEKDYDLPIWAGVLPVECGFGNPLADARLEGEIPLPEYL